MVRRKNILSTLMQCVMVMCTVGLQGVLFGYSLSFVPIPARDHWRIVAGGSARGGRRARSRLRRHHSSSCVHDLSGDVRDHHPRPDCWFHRRAYQIHGVRRVHYSLVHTGLRSHRPLGMGTGGLDETSRRAGFRGRSGRPYQRRGLLARACHAHRPPDRV